ncbi:MAG: lysophospholipid acyltransferase family protein [Patescibacteria group bacterium]
MTEDKIQSIKKYKYFPMLLQSVIYIFSLSLFKIFAKFKVYGLDNVKDLHGPVIIATNHSSEWDGILAGAAMPSFWSNYPVYYVAMGKHEYINSGWRNLVYGGFLFKLVGAYPRYKGHKNYEYSLQNFVQILNSGGKVCIFPEGRRSKNGTLAEPHGGVAFLAHKTKKSVIPVGITGLVNFNFLDLLLMKKRVSINFGKPIAPIEIVRSQNPEVQDFKSGAIYIMDKVKELLIANKEGQTK